MRPARPLGGHVIHAMKERPGFVSDALRFGRGGGCAAGCDECLYINLCEGGVFGGGPRARADSATEQEGQEQE